MEFEQADLVLRAAADGGKQPGKQMMKRRDEARSKRDEEQEHYEMNVARLNVAEQRVKTEVNAGQSSSISSSRYVLQRLIYNVLLAGGGCTGLLRAD